MTPTTEATWKAAWKTGRRPLTRSQIRTIRAKLAGGMKLLPLAIRYQRSTSTIWKIGKGILPRKRRPGG